MYGSEMCARAHFVAPGEDVWVLVSVHIRQNTDNAMFNKITRSDINRGKRASASVRVGLHNDAAAVYEWHSSWIGVQRPHAGSDAGAAATEHVERRKEARKEKGKD